MPFESITQDKKTCPTCEKEFLVGGRNGAPKTQQYCSRQCKAESRKCSQAELESKDWLQAKYVDEKRTTYEIAETLGCSQASVGRALRKHGIQVREPKECHERSLEIKVCPICKKEFETGGAGRPRRGQIYCSNRCTANSRIGPRDPKLPKVKGSNAPRPKKNRDTVHNKEWMHQKYVIEGLTTREIARLVGCAAQTIQYALARQGITVKSSIEAKKQKYDRVGRKFVSQQELIEAYGSVCACCGESAPAFLTLDHIGGGGKAHRESVPGGNKTLRVRQDLKARGWPKDKYRLLCMNCNFATRGGRTCPHQLKREQEAVADG